MRIAVAFRPGITDGRATALAATLAAEGIGGIAAIRIVDIHIVEGVPVERAALVGLLADGVAGIAIDEAPLEGADLVIEVTCRPGVHDPAGGTLREVVGLVADDLPPAATLQTARQYRFRFEEGAEPPAGRLAEALHNPLVQQVTSIAARAWERGERPPARYPPVAAEPAPAVERIDVAAMDDGALARLSDRRLLALSAAELAAIRSYAADPELRSRRREGGIGEPLTDVELEMLAQTWSEHCKHKIFNAVIDHCEDGRTERIVSLFDTYIRRTTAELDDGSGFLKSVFSDDSGVIRFDDRTLLCFKAETHNAPSALDPYGGAITGIVGVNRDIIGTGRGAKPIFNTDVLCFAPPDTPEREVPAELMHPRRMLAGVHRGIVDGGNQSGIPVVAGAFLFDPSFIGKPLVFLRNRGRAAGRGGRRASLAGTRAARRPGGHGRRTHRQGRHPRRDLLLAGPRRQLAHLRGPDRRPDRAAPGARSAAGGARRRPVPRHYRQRRRRPVIVARRDGARVGRGEHRPGRGAPEVSRSRTVGDPAVRVAGAHELGGAAGQVGGPAPSGGRPRRGALRGRPFHR